MAGSTRRDLMIGMGAFVGGGFVTAAISPLGNAVGGFLRDQAEKALDPFNYDLPAIKRVFGPIDQRASFVPGQSHPNPRYEGFHPDDEYVADRFDELVRDTVENRVTYDSESIPQDIKGTVIASGSPVSNAMARYVLEYTFVDQEDGMQGLVRASDPVFDLDYEFLLSRQALADAGLVDPIGKSGRTGNWSILRNSTGESYSSEVRDGRVNTDYLLVTCLPNFFDKESLDNGEGLFLLAGGHGVGTKGVDLLLRDSTLLGALADRIGNSLYWQAMFKIDGVDHFHKDPKFGVRWHPRRLDTKFEFSTVSFNEDRLAELAR